MRGKAAVWVLAAMCAGCVASPYDYAENWLIREDPVRTFVTPADVIYVQDELYVSVSRVPAMQLHAEDEVGRGRFSGIARVFSPLVTDCDDIEKVVDWYLAYHHEKGRPFVFLGEGKGGALLKEFQMKNLDWLQKKGLVDWHYAGAPVKEQGFVTSEMVKTIRHRVLEARYKGVWGREMPEGMLDDD